MKNLFVQTLKQNSAFFEYNIKKYLTYVQKPNPSGFKLICSHKLKTEPEACRWFDGYYGKNPWIQYGNKNSMILANKLDKLILEGKVFDIELMDLYSNKEDFVINFKHKDAEISTEFKNFSIDKVYIIRRFMKEYIKNHI